MRSPPRSTSPHRPSMQRAVPAARAWWSRKGHRLTPFLKSTAILLAVVFTITIILDLYTTHTWQQSGAMERTRHRLSDTPLPAAVRTREKTSACPSLHWPELDDLTDHARRAVEAYSTLHAVVERDRTAAAESSTEAERARGAEVGLALPQLLDCPTMRRVGSGAGGRYVCHIDRVESRQDCLVYSFVPLVEGAEATLEMERDLQVHYGCEVHLFDQELAHDSYVYHPTASESELQHHHFGLHGFALSAELCSEQFGRATTFLPIGEIQDRLGHQKRNIDVVHLSKEYTAALRATGRSPAQVVVHLACAAGVADVIVDVDLASADGQFAAVLAYLARCNVLLSKVEHDRWARGGSEIARYTFSSATPDTRLRENQQEAPVDEELPSPDAPIPLPSFSEWKKDSAPWTCGYRFSSPMEATDPIIVALRSLQRAMASVQVGFFLASGSLLRLVRDCSLEGDDVDVGVLANEYSDEIHSALRAQGFKMFREFGARLHEGYEVSYKHSSTQVQVDLFFYVLDPTGPYLWQPLWESKCKGHRCGNGRVSRLLWPLAPNKSKPHWQFAKVDVDWLNASFDQPLYIPSPPEQWLEALYGEHWRFPVKYWHWLTSPRNSQPNWKTFKDTLKLPVQQTNM